MTLQKLDPRGNCVHNFSMIDKLTGSLFVQFREGAMFFMVGPWLNNGHVHQTTKCILVHDGQMNFVLGLCLTICVFM